MEENDSALAHRAASGETDAFENLVRLHRPKLLRFLWAYLGNFSDAEDLVQDTFARAYSALHKYDHKQSFTTWLFVIGRRLAANEKRRIGRQRKREAELEVPQEVEAVYPEFDSGSIWAAAKNILPENSYAAMWLHYGENQSVKEIAQILGKSVTGVKVTLHRARRTLASEIDPDLVGERIDR